MKGYNLHELLHPPPDHNSAAAAAAAAELIHHQLPAEWSSLENNITQTFFKCIRWQVEETTDPTNCPYHYFCDSTYPGDYPPIVDILVLLFTATLYLITLVFTVQEILMIITPPTSTSTTAGAAGRGDQLVHDADYCSRRHRRYWVPSGPIALPFILLSLAKGHRINTLFPLAPCIGPALLLLLYISALAFDDDHQMINNTTVAADDMYINMKYILFELSTVSGILHASLYLDSIILPYYTGLDALVSSAGFSGECVSCVCRNEVLVVGGTLVAYRGWSLTMFSVVGALCWRIVCRLLVFHYGGGTQVDRVASSCSNLMATILVLRVIIKSILETMSWILIAIDCIYLMMNSPAQIRDGSLLERGAAYGCACILISLHALKKLQHTRTVIRQRPHYKKMSQIILKLASLGK